ncbi:hypothetical protein ACCO45_012713 [Purpureocillium lilacinum]|uniref:Uncharacterized protein n=1 Tax=Purpureocillium lilacinum TaxID=33203 RepID=A0ACC4D8S0_PURLI
MTGATFTLVVGFQLGLLQHLVIRLARGRVRGVLETSRHGVAGLRCGMHWLMGLSTGPPQHLQNRFAHMAGITDDHSICDTMDVLGIIEQGLRTGSPLPERLPALLIRRYFDSWRARYYHAAVPRKSLMRDGRYQKFCLAMSSYFEFLFSFEDLVLTLKEVLGECHVIYQ